MLSTQNPVDLDYKGLSNAGTWFLGRLQTQRDQERVLDGLVGARSESGVPVERGQIAEMLAGLRSRVFMMHNVHEDYPALFHTRWALSYLRGPLTRQQIRELAQRGLARLTTTSQETPLQSEPQDASGELPLLPPEITQYFVAPRTQERGLLYRPALLASVQVHFVSRSADVDQWQERYLLARIKEGVVDPWEEADALETLPTLFDSPADQAEFETLPSAATKVRSYTRWSKQLKSAIYRSVRLELFRSRTPKRYSKPGESEAEFRGQLLQLSREERDRKMEKLRLQYAPKLSRLRDRIERAQDQVEVQQEQHRHQRMKTWVSLGSTVMGALFGRRVGAASRAATTLTRGHRISKEKADVIRAKDRVEALQEELEQLEERFQDSLEALEAKLDSGELPVEPYEIKARKADIEVSRLSLVWLPGQNVAGGGWRDCW